MRDQIVDRREHHRTDAQQIEHQRHTGDQTKCNNAAAQARDQIRNQQDDRQQIDRRLGVGEVEEDGGQDDDPDPDCAVPGAVDENADENQQHHAGAGAVLVRKEAAPVAGKAGLGDVGCLMNRELRQERDAEIACRKNNDRGDRQQAGKMFASVGQQHQKPLPGKH